jgi:hypothetical protein
MATDERLAHVVPVAFCCTWHRMTVYGHAYQLTREVIRDYYGFMRLTRRKDAPGAVTPYDIRVECDAYSNDSCRARVVMNQLAAEDHRFLRVHVFRDGPCNFNVVPPNRDITTLAMVSIGAAW